MNNINLKFDVGDKVYYVRDDKVSQAVVLDLTVTKLVTSEGTPKTDISYRIEDKRDQYRVHRKEHFLGGTQMELFEGIRMVGEEHEVEQDLWLGR